MTNSNVNARPTARQVFEQARTILQATPVATVPQPDGLGWLLAGAAVVLGTYLLQDGN